MPELAKPYVVLRQALDGEDIAFLRQACKDRLSRDAIPCFALIDHRDHPTYRKIESAIRDQLGEPIHYLNDFYIYTDKSFRTGWHMDTELFTFEFAVNAWILLSPDRIENPLGFIPDINVDNDFYFHSVTIEGDDATFRNYRTGKTHQRSVKAIEEGQAATPEINVGDILLINPKLYHKTNVETPKHAFALKFVYGGSRKGCLSPKQVPSILWPEVKTFNDVINKTESWEDFVDGLREQLKTEDGRVKLSSGFYPDKFDLYRKMVETI